MSADWKLYGFMKSSGMQGTLLFFQFNGSRECLKLRNWEKDENLLVWSSLETCVDKTFIASRHAPVEILKILLSSNPPVFSQRYHYFVYRNESIQYKSSEVFAEHRRKAIQRLPNCWWLPHLHELKVETDVWSPLACSFITETVSASLISDL